MQSSLPIFSLASWHFLTFAFAAIVLLRCFARSKSKRWILLGLSAFFLFQFMTSVGHWLFLGALLGATFLAGEIRARSERSVGGYLGIVVIVAFWAALFLVKDPNLLGFINPFSYVPFVLVGVSYVMFRCIHYIVDAPNIENRSILTLINFTIFFPTLLSGPLERYERFQEYEHGLASEDDINLLEIFHRIANGMIKKFVIADNLMVLGFTFTGADTESWSGPMLWVGVLSQVALLYLDFSGYCDIVGGVSLLAGFKLTENFQSPWLARDIQDFWNRWHITLTQFVREYVFTPFARTIYHHVEPRWQMACVGVVYFCSMVLIALWHGTTWGFLVFGIVQGSALLVWQYLPRYEPKPGLSGAVVRVGGYTLPAFTYVFMSFTIVIGYCGVGKAWRIFMAMMGV